MVSDSVGCQQKVSENIDFDGKLIIIFEFKIIRKEKDIQISKYNNHNFMHFPVGSIHQNFYLELITLSYLHYFILLISFGSIFIDSQLFETLQTFQFYISFDDQLSRENFFLDDCFHKVQLSNAYHSRKRTLDIKTFTEKCKDRPKELKMCKKMHQRTLINLYLIM